MVIHIQRGYQPYICHSKLKCTENWTNIRTMEILRVCAKRDTFCKKCPVLRTHIDIFFFNLLQLLMHSRTWEWFLTSLHWSYCQAKSKSIQVNSNWIGRRWYYFRNFLTRIFFSTSNFFPTTLPIWISFDWAWHNSVPACL